MYPQKEVKEVVTELKTSLSYGLSLEEVEKRQKEFGLNEISEKKRKSGWLIFFSQFNNFIIYILIVATIISAISKDYVEAIVILVILILNAIMGFVQESKAEKGIEALKKMASLKANVIREGKQEEIDSKYIVPGDIIILTTGQKIPADARLFEAINLKTQEAALTGESLVIIKHTNKLKEGVKVGDMHNMVFTGTIISEGKGKAIVTSTGMNTEIGKIANLIENVKSEETPLQIKLKIFGKWLGLIILIICGIVFIAGLISRGDVFEMFKISVSLAVAAVPEGLPAVVTITLALGVKRMLKRNALIRKLSSVETLGCTTVICTDKTGTLTHNEMTVTRIFESNKIIKVIGVGYKPEGGFSEEFDNLILEISCLCNDAVLLYEDGWKINGDPTEGCLLTLARKKGINEEDLRKRFPRLDEITFDANRKMMSTIHLINNKKYCYTKGAPENIINLCNKIRINGKVRNLTEKDRKVILKQNEEFANSALRVLGFAYKQLNSRDSKKDYEKDMIFVGLLGMIDPPREEVKFAIEKCKTAGIKIVMITGDYIGTAKAIAEELGIEGRAVNGDELDNIDLDTEVENIGIYARVDPEDKMKIVTALKKKGHIVAMTGDGVNDAPALKSADIGVSMGITGTDVAKEASAMILIDDNFKSIVSAVEEGRTVYDNIKKFIGFLLAINLGEVLIFFFAMFFAIFFDWFKFNGNIVLPMTALQILWMNLITNGLPALALSFDPPAKDNMMKKPRDPKENIISRELAFSIIIISLLMTITTLGLFKFALDSSSNEFEIIKAQTLSLTLVVITSVVVVLEIIRNKYHTFILSNNLLTLSIIGSVALQFLLIYSPINKIFGLAPLQFIDWIYIAIICSIVFISYFFIETLINFFLKK
ncbi:MAG: cation-translocating P-type ATPase [Candidatus Woesearchaeota archaeon]